VDFFFAILIFVVVAAFIVLGAIYGHQQRQKRLADLRALAQSLGWQFVAEENYGYDVQFSQFSGFCQGGGRYAYNTLIGNLKVGEQPWLARMGDYHYQTTSSNGKQTTTHHHHFSYCLVKLPYPSLPDLRIRREGFFDAIAGAFGFDDIDFESAEFSKRFHVKSSDKRFAYDVVCPAMMEFILAEESPALEIDGGWCCLTTGSDTWSPAESQQHLDWARKFFELWPKHLVAALASR
jgi:hypothetical protein